MGLTMAQLDALAEKHLAKQTPPPAARKSPIDARSARQQIVGMQKWVVWMSGGEMRDEVAANELLVERIDDLEMKMAAKDAHIARLEKGLANISSVLELYASDPFELKPISKWNKGELGKWMIEAADSMTWAMTRAENELVPEHAVPLIAGPKD